MTAARFLTYDRQKPVRYYEIYVPKYVTQI